jgi:hypothetical protein
VGELKKDDLPANARKILEDYLIELLNAGVAADQLELYQEFLVPDPRFKTEDEQIAAIHVGWGLARERARRMGAKI